MKLNGKIREEENVSLLSVSFFCSDNDFQPAVKTFTPFFPVSKSC